MSSRNNRLSQDDRNKASSLYRTLCAIKNEEYISSNFIQSQKDILEQQGFTLDYLSLCNPNTLEKVSDFNERPMLVAVAASISGIRLIDNIIIT
jgi:pantothenate synthetase